MCGPWAHGWYVAETDTILEDYMTKNAHREFETPQRVLGVHPDAPCKEPLPTGTVVYQSEVKSGFVLLEPLAAIPYGIIPATGEVAVQRNQQPVFGPFRHQGGGTYVATGSFPLAPTDLAARAKSRIRATWDVAVPTVAMLIKWIEAHFGKRGDGEEWARIVPNWLVPEAQGRFFPEWTRFVRAEGWLHPAQFGPLVSKEGRDHRRICEALRRGGANDYWKQADHEDRKAKAELVLAGAN